MAFPFETSRVITNLRELYLAIADDHGYASSIIRGLGPAGDHLSESPPITFQRARYGNKYDREEHREPAKNRKARRPEKQDQSEVEDKTMPFELSRTSLDLGDYNDYITEQPVGLGYSKTIRGGRKITRFFSKKADSDSDDGSIKTLALNVIAEDELTDDGDITETESVRIHKNHDTSDVLTIDSDFGVPVNANGQVVHNLIPHDGSQPDSSLEERNLEDSYYSEEDLDDDTSSTDSAFTDIETDSILDSSLMDVFKEDALEDYKEGLKDGTYTDEDKLTYKDDLFKIPFKEEKEESYPGEPSSFKDQKKRRRKFKTIKQSHPKSITFEKVDLAKNLTNESNLSFLIQLKKQVYSVHPLTYYSFADPTMSESSGVKINLFVPPNNEPITEIRVNESIPIVDVIGYILLELSNKFPEYKQKAMDTEFANPNQWRIELVDEDGENYGGFGILDRNRVLSLYNTPHDLALCRVSNESEVLKNEKSSPLSMEFKQRVLAFKRSSTEQILEVKRGAGRTQLKILAKQVNGPHTTTMFLAETSNTIAQVVHDYCSQQGLAPMKYKFREVLYNSDPMTLPTAQGSIPEILPGAAIGTHTKPLNDSDIVSDLKFNTVELCLAHVYDSLMVNHITPGESTFAITPERRNLEEKLHQFTLSEPRSPVVKAPTAENIRREMTSKKYLDDIMTGKNPLLPANLNTIYFKWKVTRKKTTILNKIEKSLVLDGDYIHLTPSDDIVLTDSPFDNFVQNQHNSSNHHHHHLYHYNYNNYYKELMMKTSLFHITQITKLKQYKDSKNPNHFKIVIRKQDLVAPTSKEAVKKKYDLEAVTVAECQEIIDKINWVKQVYASNALTVGRNL